MVTSQNEEVKTPLAPPDLGLTRGLAGWVLFKSIENFAGETEVKII